MSLDETKEKAMGMFADGVTAEEVSVQLNQPLVLVEDWYRELFPDKNDLTPTLVGEIVKAKIVEDGLSPDSVVAITENIVKLSAQDYEDPIRQKSLLMALEIVERAVKLKDNLLGNNVTAGGSLSVFLENKRD